MVLLTSELIKYTIIGNYTQRDTFENISVCGHPLHVCLSLTVKPKM